MNEAPIVFRLLGGLELTGPDGQDVPAVLAQPKRLALLAYLAAAPPYGYHRRDTLLGLFWPDLDQVHARRALNRAVYFLRSALGDAAIISRGNEEVGLGPDRVWCDVRAFDEALAATRFHEALNLYRGDLLVGFFVGEAPEFERWLEEQRSACRTRAADAARAVTGQYEAAGNFTPAIGFARRAADYAPDDERALRRLVVLLDKAGDRAGALRAYEVFAARLATELGAQPSAETRQLVDRLRKDQSPGRPPVTSELTASNGPNAEAAAVPVTGEIRSSTHPGTGLPGYGGTPGTMRQRLASPRTLLTVGAVLALASIAAIQAGPSLAALFDRADLRRSSQPKRVLVADFESAPADRPLARTVREVASSIIDRSKVVATVPPNRLADARRDAMISDSSPLTGEHARHVAYRTDVHAIVAGRIDRLGASTYSIIVRGVNPTSGAVIASADSVGRHETVVPIVERLLKRMAPSLQREGDTVGVMTRRLPDFGPMRGVTPSLEAYKALLQSYDAERHGNTRQALKLARDALALDTGFTAAWSWTAEIYAGLGIADSARFAFDQARRGSDRLTPTARLALDAAIARFDGDFAAAVRLWSAVLQETPSDGPILMDRGHALGTLGEYDAAFESFRRAAALIPEGRSPVRLFSLAAIHLSLGRLNDARALQPKLPENMRTWLGLWLTVADADWQRVERLGAAAEANPNDPLRSRAFGALHVAAAQAARGRVAAAHQSIRRGATLVEPDDATVDMYRALLEVASGRSSGMEPILAADDAPMTHVAPGIWYAWSGDFGAATRELAIVRSGSRFQTDPRAREADMLEALIAARRGQSRDVVRLLAPAAWRGAIGAFPGFSLNTRRWLVADAYDRLGQPDSAAAYFELLVKPMRIRMDEQRSKGLVFSFAHRRLALLYTRMGQHERARQHWRTFVDTFNQPDPEFRAMVEEARRAL